LSCFVENDAFRHANETCLSMKTSLLSLCALAGMQLLSAISLGGELHPIVDAGEGFLVGASGDGKWWEGARAVKAVREGTSVRLFSLTRELGIVKAGAPKPAGEPLPDVWTVPLTDAPHEAVIGVVASWDPLPRKPKLADPTQPAYVEAVRKYLQSRGIVKPDVKITKIVRIDLDGDGTDEVLISATNYFEKGGDSDIPNGAPAGSYSCILLRRETKGGVETQLLAGDFYPKKQTFNAPQRHEIVAVLDLTGDHKMEVVLHSSYYEGGWTAVYECARGKVKKVLEAGGGA